ncbi:thiamine transporter 2-like, partial [Aphis craccivora]
LTVSKDEAFGNLRTLRRRSPGLHTGYGAIINKRPVPCSVMEPEAPSSFSESQAKIYVSSGANESQAMERVATVDVATTAIINRKTSPGGSGDYTMPPPINTSAEHKIVSIQSYLTVARPTQADLRGLGTTDYTAPCCSKTHPGQTCAFLVYSITFIILAIVYGCAAVILTEKNMSATRRFSSLL